MSTKPKAEQAETPAVENVEVAPEVSTQVVHSETVVVDNTDVEETAIENVEAEETDLGTGTVMVSYR